MATTKIGDREVTLRPVPVGVLKRLWPKISAPGEDLPANIDVMEEFVRASAGDQLTSETLDGLSLPDLAAAFDAAMEASGLSRRRFPGPGAPSP